MTLLCFVSSGGIIFSRHEFIANPLFFSITGIVKRDTIEDIGNSIVNSVKEVVGMDEDRGIIEDMKIEVICLIIFMNFDKIGQIIPIISVIHSKV